MTYPGYEPVKILDTLAKIQGQQIYYHKARDEYAIERGGRFLTALETSDQIKLDGMRNLEQSAFDAQDRHDDDGKEMVR